MLPRRFLHSTRIILNSGIPGKCPNCAQAFLSFVPACNKCWSIQSLPSTKYHKLFGLNSSNPYDLDPVALKERYRQAQRACHPDTWASKGPTKHTIAESLSAQVNQAYNTLLNPLSRAEYILESNGYPMSEHDQVDDMELMSEIMMAREMIHEDDDITAIQELREENNEKMRNVEEIIKAEIETSNWETAKRFAMRLKYLQGVEDAAKQRLDSH